MNAFVFVAKNVAIHLSIDAVYDGRLIYIVCCCVISGYILIACG